MSQELLYTSAPRGLWPGSHGYCTVACSERMPRALAERLEGLSVYRNLFAPHDPQAHLNPASLSAWRVPMGGTTHHVLSRVCAAGLDYTDRTNKLAHHVVLDPGELPPAGPAWLLGRPGFLADRWDGTVGFLPESRAVPYGDVRPAPCLAWKDTVGDAGWAGVLAETFLADPRRLVYLVYDPGVELLPLIAEAQGLLPPDRRWDLTFTTYFTNLPQGVSCSWRGVVRGTPEAVQALRQPQALVLDLGTPLGQAVGGPLVEQARTGRPARLSPGALGMPPILPGAVAAPMGASPVASLHGAHDDASVPPSLPTGEGVASSESRPSRRPVSQTSRWRPRPRTIVAACLLLALVSGSLLTAVALLKPWKGKETAKPQNLLSQNASQRKAPPPTSRPVVATQPGSPAAPPHADHQAQVVQPIPTNSKQEILEPTSEKSGFPSSRAPETVQSPAPNNTQDEKPPVDLSHSQRAKPAEGHMDAIASQPPAEREKNNDQHQITYHEIKKPNPVSGPISEDQVIFNNLKNGKSKISLVGFDDKDLGVSASRINQKPDGLEGFDVRTGSNEPLARFRVEGQTVRFRWLEDPGTKYEDHLKILRSCLLSIEPQSDPSTETPKKHHVALWHKPIEKTSTLTLANREQHIDFYEKLPYGRRPVISFCETSESEQFPRPDDGQRETENRPRFSIAKYPNLYIIISIEYGEIRPNGKRLALDKLKLARIPDESEAIDSFFNLLSGFQKNNSGGAAAKPKPGLSEKDQEILTYFLTPFNREKIKDFIASSRSKRGRSEFLREVRDYTESFWFASKSDRFITFRSLIDLEIDLGKNKGGDPLKAPFNIDLSVNVSDIPVTVAKFRAPNPAQDMNVGRKAKP